MLFDNPEYAFQQFTGLLDKNGKEIYAGDIVTGITVFSGFKNGEVDSEIFDFTGVITFKDGSFQCDSADFPLNCYENIKVIGNIFENPELLK